MEEQIKLDLLTVEVNLVIKEGEFRGDEDINSRVDLSRHVEEFRLIVCDDGFQGEYRNKVKKIQHVRDKIPRGEVDELLKELRLKLLGILKR